MTDALDRLVDQIVRPRQPSRIVPPLGARVQVPGGAYRLGEPGEERTVRLPSSSIGRWPVVNAHFRRFVAATGHPVTALLAAKLGDAALADHPVTDVTFADAQAFCVWASGELGARVRLPTGDEWEAAARGTDGRSWPWGNVFEPACCASAESGLGWTSPVTAHPDGVSPWGALDLAGNVWEWVLDQSFSGGLDQSFSGGLDETEEGVWRSCRGGSFLDHAWGVRVMRSLPADPRRPTRTTGFRMLIEVKGCDGTR